MEKISGGMLDYSAVTFSVSLVSESVLDEKSLHPSVLTKMSGKHKGSRLGLSLTY